MMMTTTQENLPSAQHWNFFETFDYWQSPKPISKLKSKRFLDDDHVKEHNVGYVGNSEDYIINALFQM